MMNVGGRGDVLGRIIEQANIECHMQEWQLCLASFSNYVSWSIFLLHFLFVGDNSATFQNILILLGSIMYRSIWSVICKNDNSAGLYFLVKSPDPYFTSSLACISVTIWNILMIPCLMIQQVNAKCLVLEWRLLFFIFLIISPDPYFNSCSCWKTWFSWNFHVSCFFCCIFVYIDVQMWEILRHLRINKIPRKEIHPPLFQLCPFGFLFFFFFFFFFFFSV